MIEANDIRRQLEEVLGFPLREEMWGYLVDKQYINEVQQGLQTIPDLAEEIGLLLRAAGYRLTERKPSAPRKPRKLKDLLSTDEAWFMYDLVITFLIAKRVEKDEAVQEFRTQILGGKLLHEEEVEEWIQRQRPEDRKLRSWWLTDIPIPPHIVSQLFDQTHPAPSTINLEVSPQQILAHLQNHTLKYLLPEDGHEHQVATVEGGNLEELRELSHSLAKRYRWTEAEVATFILTGVVPMMRRVTSKKERSTILPALTRITLTIDPTLSPRELANFYSSLRTEVIGPRHRELTDKHLLLALHADDKNTDESWSESMVQWNKSFPDWKYTEASIFARDCTQALQRLLNPDYPIDWFWK